MQLEGKHAAFQVELCEFGINVLPVSWDARGDHAAQLAQVRLSDSQERSFPNEHIDISTPYTIKTIWSFFSRYLMKHHEIFFHTSNGSGLSLSDT